MDIDRLLKIMGVMIGFVGVIFFMSGKFILAAIMLFFVFAVFFTAGKGTFNEKNLYKKKLKRKGKTLDDVYDFFKDTETMLGFCWRGQHNGNDAVIFGPSTFKDIVAIEVNGDEFLLTNSNVVETLTAGQEDQWRLEQVVDTTDFKVTPKWFSTFGALKVSTAVLLNDFVKELEALTGGIKSHAPSSMNIYNFFRHDTGENILYDENDNFILSSKISQAPMKIRLLDEDGEELAELHSRKENYNYKDPMSQTFDVYSDGELFCSIKQLKGNKHDTFKISSVNGDFYATSFMAVIKANVSSNYIIEKDGERKAIVFGSVKINFEDAGGWIQPCGICSMDDDYLVLYTLFELFLINASHWLK